MADLNCVYKSAMLNAEEGALDEPEGKWGDKYPVVIKPCRSEWEPRPSYFKFPDYMCVSRYTPAMP